MVLVLPELLAAELGGPDHQQGGAHRKHLDAMDEVVTPAEPRGVIHLVLEENASRGLILWETWLEHAGTSTNENGGFDKRIS